MWGKFLGLAQTEFEGNEGVDEARPRRLGRDHPGSGELEEEEETLDDEEEEADGVVRDVKVLTKRGQPRVVWDMELQRRHWRRSGETVQLALA